MSAREMLVAEIVKSVLTVEDTAEIPDKELLTAAGFAVQELQSSGISAELLYADQKDGELPLWDDSIEVSGERFFLFSDYDLIDEIRVRLRDRAMIAQKYESMFCAV